MSGTPEVPAFPEGLTDEEVAEMAREGLVTIYAAAAGVAERIIAEAERVTDGRLAVLRDKEPRNLTDLTYGDLSRMAASAKAYTACFAIVRRWLLPSDTRTLGNLLKILPADDATEIVRLLKIATEDQH